MHRYISRFARIANALQAQAKIIRCSKKREIRIPFFFFFFEIFSNFQESATREQRGAQREEQTRKMTSPIVSVAIERDFSLDFSPEFSRAERSVRIRKRKKKKKSPERVKEEEKQEEEERKCLQRHRLRHQLVDRRLCLCMHSQLNNKDNRHSSSRRLKVRFMRRRLNITCSKDKVQIKVRFNSNSSRRLLNNIRVHIISSISKRRLLKAPIISSRRLKRVRIISSHRLKRVRIISSRRLNKAHTINSRLSKVHIISSRLRAPIISRRLSNISRAIRIMPVWHRLMPIPALRLQAAGKRWRQRLGLGQ
jgi:hypothetical protein